MKCPKCGNDIKDGHLYCDVCGEEIRIVPDFDETVDENIKLSFSDVIDTDSVIDGVSKLATKEISSEIEKEATKEIPRPDNTDKKINIEDITQPEKKSILKALVLAGAICAVLALFTIIAIVINKQVNNYYSVDEQYEKAFEQYEEANYEESIKIVKHAIDIDETDTRLKLLLADNYYMLNKFDESNAVLYDLLDEFPDDPNIIDKIVENYKALGDYKSINSLLSNNEDNDELADYSEFYSKDVEFSIPEGSYDEVKYLELTSSDDTTIYYSIDGSEATENSLVYTEPIELSQGEYVINAIAVNSYGIKSNNVVKSYNIDFFVPDAPVLKTGSGTYNIPKPIEVSFADYDLCYYTVDGEDPTLDDFMYNGPIPMYIGDHTYKFAVISNKGVSSEVVTLNITLDLIILIDMDMAKNAVIVANSSKGGGNYTYECEQACEYNEKVYYIVNEYISKESGKEQTGNHYAVDVLTGVAYRAILNKSTGKFTIEAII